MNSYQQLLGWGAKKPSEDSKHQEAQGEKSNQNTQDEKQIKNSQNIQKDDQSRNLSQTQQNSSFSKAQQNQQSIPQDTSSTQQNIQNSKNYNPPNIFSGLATKQPQSSSQLNTSGNQANLSTEQIGSSGIGLFSNLNISTTTQPPQNPLFAGLQPKEPVKNVDSNPLDIFTSMNVQNKASQPFTNPYSKQKQGEFQSSYLQGTSFNPPPPYPNNQVNYNSSHNYDPFSEIDKMLDQPSQQQQTPIISESGRPSAFGFLQSQTPTNANKILSFQKSPGGQEIANADISMSSIQNISKHSFEEVEKQDGQQSNNHYLAKPLDNVQNTQQEATGFYFLSGSKSQQEQTNNSRMQEIQQTKHDNSSGAGLGTFEVDKSLGKEENFEEIMESKDIIEDRLLRLKHLMIDFTIKQQELSEKIQTLKKDIELLQTKLEDTTYSQQKAIEEEDYEEADSLNAKITQTKKLIQSKEGFIKKLDEDYMAYENKKGDKFRELSSLIHKSLSKMMELRTKQQLEKEQFEESEIIAIEQKKKGLHYESIRIEEIKKDINASRETVNEKLQEIDQKVFEDTKEEHQEKTETEHKIEFVDKEIEEIEELLKVKKEERENLLQIKQGFEREIDKARSKFRDEILKLESQLDKAQKSEDKNNKDFGEQKREQLELDEYQESYKTRIEGYQKELKEMEEFEKQLKKNVAQVDSTMSEKDQNREEAYKIKQEINNLKIKRDNIVGNKDFLSEKLAKVEADNDALQLELSNLEKKIQNLEQEKKKAATQKKFKEAQKAQQEIKENQQVFDQQQEKLGKVKQERFMLDQEIGKKEEDIKILNKQLKQDQEKIEKVQLRILAYRKDDIIDLLNCLDNTGKIQGLKKSELKRKQDCLNQELLKIDEELFELEKKYGEFNKKVSIQREQFNEPQQEINVLEEDMKQVPKVEESSLQDETIDENPQPIIYQTEKQEEEQQKEEDFPKRDKQEIINEIQQVRQQIQEFESLMEKAAEVEDYEQADQYQTQIDQLKDNQLPQLQKELGEAEVLGEEKEIITEQIQTQSQQEKESYQPPNIYSDIDYSPSPITKKEEKFSDGEEEQLKYMSKDEQSIEEDIKVPEDNTEQQQQQQQEELENSNNNQQIQDLPEEQNLEELPEQQQQEILQQEPQIQENLEIEEKFETEELPQQNEDQKQEDENGYQPPNLFAGLNFK